MLEGDVPESQIYPPAKLSQMMAEVARVGQQMIRSEQGLLRAVKGVMFVE